MENRKETWLRLAQPWVVVVACALVPVVADSEKIPPVESFSRLPLVEDVRLSPNGKHLAYVMNIKDIAVLTTQTIGVNEHVPILRFDHEMRLTWFRWANDERILLGGTFPASRDGIDTMESRLVSIARDGSGLRVLMRPPVTTRHLSQTQDNVVNLLPDDPKHVLVALDRDKPNFPGVYRIDVATGKSATVLAARHPVRDWMTDQQDRVRIAIGLENGVEWVKFLDLERDKWVKLWRYELINEPPISVMGFDLDPNILYVRALHEGTFSVFKIKLSDPARAMELVSHDPNHDIEGSLIYSRATRDVIGIHHRGEDNRIEYWNENFGKLQDALDAGLPDTVNVLTDFSRDERRYIAFAISDAKPGVYYFGSRETGKLHVFGETYPELAEFELSGKEAVKYEARDGLTIEGYLTRPWGDPPRPWPTVILPHGGPSARDYADFDYWTEFLASRGYAVLQMNFRGSSGYGWKFMSAGYKAFGRQMQDDITDGTHWAVEQGLTDPERVCIAGGSYGGYAALWAAVKTPELFRCAISVNGVSDWAMMLTRSRFYVQSDVVEEMLGARSGLKEVSPLKRASEIRIPVLILHGEDDRVVPVKQSRKMAKALGRLGKEHRYIELEDGDHHLSDFRNRTITLGAIESFLAEHLSTEERGN